MSEGVQNIVRTRERLIYTQKSSEGAITLAGLTSSVVVFFVLRALGYLRESITHSS